MTDAERRKRAANLKRRLAMLRRHHQARDPVSGKSAIAVAGGLSAGRAAADSDPDGPSAFGLKLALRRWHANAANEGNEK